MSITSRLVRHVTYPLWLAREGQSGVQGHYKTLSMVANGSAEQWQTYQLDRLHKMVSHAAINVPYYHHLFAQGRPFPSENFTLKDFSQLPVLDKKAIRANTDRLTDQRQPADALLWDSTGGSTGTPMKFARSLECLMLRRAQDRYLDTWFNYHIGDKVALFVAAAHFHGTGTRIKAAIRRHTYDRMLRFDPSQTSEADLQAFYDEYVRFRPKIIKSFPNALLIFAEYVQEHGLPIDPVTTVFCTGENLYDWQRETFQRVFQGKIVERYGTKECGTIASECMAKDGLHVFAPGVLLEVVKEDNSPCAPGEMGRVIVTDLFNDAMPLLRYEIGDMAVAAAPGICSCGSSLPKIQSLLGRDRDIIVDSDGRLRPGYLFVDAINKLDIDAQLQLVQTADGSLELRVAQLKSPQHLIDTLVEKFKLLVGPRREVRVVTKEEIARDPSGKYRYVLSQFDRKSRV